MNWLCKICHFTTSKRLDLLKHYRLQHGHFGRNQSVPCLHSDCPCNFRTWGAVRIHLPRYYSHTTEPGQLLSFKCLVCNSHCFHTERHYFEHLGVHLNKFETVSCVFKDCDYKTNIYTTFHSHKSRKHSPHSLEDFKHMKKVNLLKVKITVTLSLWRIKTWTKLLSRDWVCCSLNWNAFSMCLIHA